MLSVWNHAVKKRLYSSFSKEKIMAPIKRKEEVLSSAFPIKSLKIGSIDSSLQVPFPIYVRHSYGHLDPWLVPLTHAIKPCSLLIEGYVERHV